MLASSTCSLGVRLEITNVLAPEGKHDVREGGPSKPLTCIVKASNYNAWKVSVSFPVKYQIDCANKRNNKPVEDDVFPRVFETRIASDNSCVCSVNGQTRVTLQHHDRNECETNSKSAREQCWTSYKKMMSMKAEVTQGGLPKFAVQKPCLECTQKYCYNLEDMLLATASLPSLTTSLSAQESKLLFSTLRNLTDSDADLSKIMSDLDRIDGEIDQLIREAEKASAGTLLDIAKTTMGNVRLALQHGSAAQDEQSLATTLKSAESSLATTLLALDKKRTKSKGEAEKTFLNKAMEAVQSAETDLESADKTLESARQALHRASALKPKLKPELTVNTQVTTQEPRSIGRRKPDKPFPVSSTPRTYSGRPKTPVPPHYAYRCCCAKVNDKIYAVRVVLAENESQVGLAVGASGWSNGTEDSQACPRISSVKPIFTRDNANSVCACTTEFMFFKSSNKCGGAWGSVDANRLAVDTHHVDNDIWSTKQEKKECSEGCMYPKAVVKEECLD